MKNVKVYMINSLENPQLINSLWVSLVKSNFDETVIKSHKILKIT